MKKILKIIFILSLILTTACSSVFELSENNIKQIDIPHYIIQDLKSKHKDFLNDTNVIIITKFDNISDSEVVYGVYDKGYVQDIEVRPDSISFSFKNFDEIHGKLFIWESNDRIKKPSEVYKVFNKYNVRIDSCAYKYRYETNNVKKLTSCTNNRKSFFTDNDFLSIYYKAKVNIKKKRLILKTVRR